jgi:hypothetical protein
MKLNIASLVLLATPFVTFAQSHIRIQGGTPANRTFLSVGRDGSYADLYGFDDLSGRQRWRIEPLGNGYAHIRIDGGTPENRRLLSVTADGTKVDLYGVDDGSGRLLWKVEPAGGGYSHIRVGGGTPSDRQYLSVTADGSKVDLYGVDDGSGRQRWSIASVDPQPTRASQPTSSVIDRAPNKIRFENRGAFQARFSVNGQQPDEVVAGQNSETNWAGQTRGVAVKGEYLGFAGWKNIFTGTLDDRYLVSGGDACVRVSGTAFKPSFGPCQ